MKQRVKVTMTDGTVVEVANAHAAYRGDWLSVTTFANKEHHTSVWPSRLIVKVETSEGSGR